MLSPGKLFSILVIFIWVGHDLTPVIAKGKILEYYCMKGVFCT